MDQHSSLTAVLRPDGIGVAGAARPRVEVRAALLLFAAALVLRLGWAAAMGLDGLYGQDAYYLLEEGEALLRTGRHAGTDAIGAPAVVAAALALGGGRPVAVQVALALIGAAAVVAVALLARSLGMSRGTAWLAGGLTALAPEHVAQSLLVMTDGPAVFWLVLGLLGAVRWAREPHRPWALLAAVGLAGAVATRYVTALALLPLAAYLMGRVRGQGSRFKGQGSRVGREDAGAAELFRSGTRHLARPATLDPRSLTPGGWWLALAAVVGGAILWVEWQHSRLGVPSGHMLAEWSPANAFRREFDDIRGHVVLAHPIGLGYLRALGSWGFLSPVLLPVAAYGAWRLRRDPAGLFLAAWAGVFFLFLCGLQVVARRYLLPALPPLAILAAEGLAVLWAKGQGSGVKGRRARVEGRGLGVALVGGAMLAAAMGAGTYLNLRPLADRKRCEREVVRWVEENTPVGSRVAAVEVGLALRRYASREVLLLHESDPATWRLPPGETPGLYVVWDPAFLARHLQKRPVPGDRAAALAPHARWLREHAQLTLLARVCRWDVLRVNALVRVREQQE